MLDRRYGEALIFDNLVTCVMSANARVGRKAHSVCACGVVVTHLLAMQETRVRFSVGALDGGVASVGMKHLVCNQKFESSILSTSTLFCLLQLSA